MYASGHELDYYNQKKKQKKNNLWTGIKWQHNILEPKSDITTDAPNIPDSILSVSYW